MNMGATRIFVIFILSHLVGLHRAQEEESSHSPGCIPFECGDLGIIKFPFSNTTNPECGVCQVDCDNRRVKLGNEPQWYNVSSISQADTIEIQFPQLYDRFNSGSCDSFQNFTLPNTPSISFTIFNNISFYKCTDSNVPEIFRGHHRYRDCAGYSVYYRYPYPPQENVSITASVPSSCSVIQLPVNLTRLQQFSTDPFNFLTDRVTIIWHLTPECLECHHHRRGKCTTNENHEFLCANAKQVAGRHNKLGVILGAAIAGGLVTICAVIFIIWHRNKWNYLPYFLSRNTSSVPSSAADLEGGSVYFGVPVFSYSELEEATNNFDPSKELGDGGFGTVYYGKLRDGREVAVKRLYENNYKRVEQFMNEIEILKCLRHPNLVVLYGCTSRRSSELLLVYEYIPNGTVADHIHGDRSSPGSLPWPTRMNIAVETASALVYLHASDIIHRDVKTNNILLDSNFCVKVADFGLSRLFPCGVTHVSTAPQGTPGYVDPEYHQCYQLTDKSDVYSFGVVLIELISSMPAVDITRHRHEINLANLAINRIQNNAFNELIDPSLGFRSDAEVERMTTCVAELAFRCLQLEKEMRPAMVEVLEALKEIRGDECNVEKNDSLDDLESGIPPPPSPESDVVVLLKNTNRLPSSPNSVADKWVSSASNTASSIG